MQAGLFFFWIVTLLVGAPQAALPEQRMTTSSPHGNLRMACENCHTFSAWKPIRRAPEFNHNQTSYPLRGMHTPVACRDCHTNLVFTKAGKQCSDCHADIHKGQFGATCEQCHTVRGWRVSVATIKQHQNRFPLIGAHAAVTCESCHKGAAVGQFRGLSTDCISCHAADYSRTKSPNHVTAGFPTQCNSCHSNVDTWSGARFDHGKVTGFALTGSHANLECSSCHQNGHYQGTSANCFSCHQKDYGNARNPDHMKAGFPTECSRCHNTMAWAGATFDHNTFTTFALTGMHQQVACTQCHINGKFAGTSRQCQSCHLTAFQQTKNPGHVAAGFPQDCSICHSTAGWMGARFDHATTKFPLTGAHMPLACASCHAAGQYAGLNTACASCHLQKFMNTTNPNHASAGFPQTCEVCHSTTAWTPASFNHSQTAFPLTGAHVSTPCASCHIGGVYKGTPKDCYTCHRTDFNGTTNPNHAAAGFPTTCTSCHTTATWLGAKFTHNQFPIYSGAHAGKWSTCADCHNNPSNFTAFTCLTCHEHNKTSMDSKHQGVRSYVYNSVNCYGCHANGRVP